MNQDLSSGKIFCGLTVHEANQALAEFCCTPLIQEQDERFEERSDFGTIARGIAHQNSFLRSLKYTESLDAMSQVERKMTPDKRRLYIIGLAQATTSTALSGFWGFLTEIDAVFILATCPAEDRARAALIALELAQPTSLS